MAKRKQYAIHTDFKKWEKFHPPLGKVSLAIMNFVMRLFFRPPKSNDQILVEKFKIPFEKRMKVKAYLYSPRNIEKNSACLVYYHGGGFVMPAAQSHYHYAFEYAKKANCKVLFVDYPLAPKHKFPVPTNASFCAYKWLVENAGNFDIDKSRIAVGGDSAGGNLSSVICFMASDKQITPPCAQMLIYPAIGNSKRSKSMVEFTDTPMCNSKDYDKFCKLYFESEEQMMSEKYVSPLNCTNLKIFPKTYIETAEFDCLRDDAKLFARLLTRAGVDVTVHNTKGTIHGYDIVEDSAITQESLKKRIEFLNEVFKTD